MPEPYSADDATVAREKAEFYATHPDWQHRPVPPGDGWVHRILNVWRALLAAQNGQDVDDGVCHRPHKIERYLAAFAPVETHPRVLILGAGVGREVIVAREAGYTVEGSTLGPRNVAFAKERFGLDLLFTDAHALPRETGSFDVVIGCQVLEHSWAPLMLLIECARVLRPGGVCIMETPPAHAWTMGWNLHHALCPTPRQALGLFAKAGLVEARVEVCEGETRRALCRGTHTDRCVTAPAGCVDAVQTSDIVTVGQRWRPGTADETVVEPPIRIFTSWAG